MVRQRENFLVLMNNFGMALEMQTAQANSAGLAIERYGTYLDSVEAHANKMKAAWEGVWQTTINSDTIKKFYDISAGFANFVKSAGGLVPVLTALGGAILLGNVQKIASSFMALKKTFDSLRQGATTLITAVKNFGRASVVAAEQGEAANIAAGTASANAWAVATAGLTLVIGLIAVVISEIPTASEKLEKLNSEIEESNSRLESLRSGKKQLSEIGDEFEYLRTKTNRTNIEQERFLELQSQIHSIIPSVNGYYDDMGNFILIASENLQALNEKQQEAIDLEEELNQIKLKQYFTDTGTADFETETDKLNKLISKYNRAKIGQEGYGAGSLWGLIDTEQLGLEIEAQKVVVEQAQDEIASKFQQLSEENKQFVLKSLKAQGDAGKALYDYLIQLWASGIDPSLVSSGIDAIGESAGKSAPSVEDLIRSLSKLESIINIVSSAQEEQSKNGSLSAETVIELIEANSSLIPFLTQTADGFLLDSEAAKKALFDEMQLMFAKYNLASAAQAAAQGNYIFAASAIAASSATEEEKKAMMDLLKAFASFAPSISVGGGGGVSSAKSALDVMIDTIKQEKNAQKDRLKDQLDAYRRIINARKDLLKSLKDELDYKDELAEKEKSVSKIQQELIELSLDNSEEAQAKRLELQEQLADAQKDLDKTQRDRQYDLEMDALNKELQLYEDMINSQIDIIDEFLKNAVALMEEAMRRLGITSSSGGSSGSGASGEGTVKTLDLGTSSERQKLKEQGVVKTYHSGIDVGPVGGLQLQSSEEFIKAMKGEVLVTPSQMNRFMKTTLPSMVSSSASGGIAIDNLIRIDGNVDKSVLPNLEEVSRQVVEKLNKILLARGYVRSTNQYTI